MANSSSYPERFRCTYKSATLILCTGNVLMALFMLHVALAPVYNSTSASSSSSESPGRIGQAEEELERIEDSNRMRREMLPFHLIERLKEIQDETELEIKKTEALNFARQNVAAEISQRLREFKISNSQSTEKALEEWRKKKLEQRSNSATAPSVGRNDKALDSRIQYLGNGMPSSGNSVDMEDGIIAGRPVPPECHAEAHTDYAGVAVRWGLSHHVDSAADCCQACLDQASTATGQQKKCNVWVYCPNEGGCYSPDKYTHKNHECWLKQADEPEINFKGHYDEEFLQQHPRAPSVVPWVSGVVVS